MSQLKVNTIRHTGASSDAITLAADGKATYAATSGTSNFTISDGNLVIGTAGHGIDFSAHTDQGSGETVSTNGSILDDFEHGTWTPSNSAVGLASSSPAPQGTYTKIGSRVIFDFLFKVSSNTDTSNGLYVDGLPFTSSGVGGNYDHGGTVTYTDNGSSVSFLVHNAGVRLQFYLANGGYITNDTSSNRSFRGFGIINVA